MYKPIFFRKFGDYFTIYIYYIMKQLLMLLTLLIPVVILAQVSPAKLKEHYKKVQQSREKNKVVTSLDTIFVGGTPYALMIEDESSVLWVKNYMIYGLDGTDLIFISNDSYDKPNPAMTSTNGIEKVSYRIFKFLESEEECEIRWTIGLDLDEVIAKNNLIKDNGINQEAAHKFVIKNGKKFSEEKSRITMTVSTNGGNVGNQYANHYGNGYANGTNVNVNINTNGNKNAPAPASSNAVLVERNRSAHLYVFGNKLQQDLKDIGFANEKTELANGKSYKVITFSLPDGTVIAEAKGESFNSKTMIVTTISDHKRHTITYDFVNKQIENLAQYLIDHYYL